MTSQRVIIVGTLCLALQVAEAFSNIRGSALEHLKSDVSTQKSNTRLTIDWGTMGMGAGIGLLVGGIVAGGVIFATRKKEEPQDAEEGGDGPADPLLGAEGAEEKKTDYMAMLQAMATKVSEDVGPKLDKGGSVRTVLENRAASFQDKAKNFLLNEMNGTASAIMREMESEESMLLLEWNNAVESNFPPASILIAGVLSPTVINFMSLHHLVQMLTVGLPLFALCIWAIYIDHASPCKAIPTVFIWLYTQTVLAFCFFVGHGILFGKLHSGQRSLKAKREEVEENLKATAAGGFSNMREQFIGNTIILQEALIIENNVRHSFWNTIVGVATVAWLLTTIWNLVLVVGWTFVPGVVAFHPDAAEVAGDDFCGAWATVFVLKVCILLSVLYLFLNLATVAQWFCDMMIDSKAFSDAILIQARKADRGGTGLPVVEMLAKAFLLRGGDESLISKLAVVQHHKKSLENKQCGVKDRLEKLSRDIATAALEEAELQNKASTEGGDLAAAVHKLNKDSSNYDNWKRQGETAIRAAKDNDLAVEETPDTKELERVYEQINKIIDDVQNSETAQAAKAAMLEKAHELEKAARKAYKDMEDTINSPEFQAKIEELKNQAMAAAKELSEEAQSLANDAIAAANDPEVQAKIKAAMEDARKAMEQAKDAAEKAVNDPELHKKVKEAMAAAEAKAEEAAKLVTDPEIQKQMQETAQRTLEQVQNTAKSATEAMLDPEIQRQIQNKALEAMAAGREAAEKAAKEFEAGTQEMKEEALKKIQEAQDAAQQAAALATDPKERQRFEDAARKAKEDFDALTEKAKKAAEEGAEKAKKAAEEAGQQASAAAAEQTEKAKKAAEEAGQKASAAAQEAAKQVGEKAEQAKKDAEKVAKDVGEKAEQAKKDAEKVAKDVGDAAQQAATEVAAKAKGKKSKK